MNCLSKTPQLCAEQPSACTQQCDKVSSATTSFAEEGYIDFTGEQASESIVEWCWGYVWARGGLDKKTRSLLDLAITAAMGRPNELTFHVKIALGNGVSVDEIKGVLLHATIHAGVPVGLEAFKSVQHALLAHERKNRTDMTPMPRRVLPQAE